MIQLNLKIYFPIKNDQTPGSRWYFFRLTHTVVLPQWMTSVGNTSLLIIQCTYGGEWNIPQLKNISISQMSLRCAWSLPNSLNNFDSCRVCRWFTSGERIEIVQPLSPHSSLPPPQQQQQLVCGKHPLQRKREEQIVKNINFATFLLGLPKSFKPAISGDGDNFNGWKVRLQSFCCALSVSLSTVRLNEKWVMDVYGLTSHHQWVYDGTLSGAAPLKLPHCCVSC